MSVRIASKLESGALQTRRDARSGGAGSHGFAERASRRRAHRPWRGSRGSVQRRLREVNVVAGPSGIAFHAMALQTPCFSLCLRASVANLFPARAAAFSSDRYSRTESAPVKSLIQRELAFFCPQQKRLCAVCPYFPQFVLAWSLATSRTLEAPIATRETRISSNEHAH